MSEWEEVGSIDNAGEWEEVGEVVDTSLPTEDPSILESGLRGLGQGISFGFADEITGGIESLFTDKTYEEARDESREAYREAQEANPGTYLAGELGSALIPGFGVLKGVQGATKLSKLATKSPTLMKMIKSNPKLAKTLENVPAGIATGTLAGGTAALGATEEETVAGQAADVLEGSLLGGGVGAALPIGGAALKAGAKGTGKAIDKVLDFTTGTDSQDRSDLFKRYFDSFRGKSPRIEELIDGDSRKSAINVKYLIDEERKILGDEIARLGRDSDRVLSDTSFTRKIDDVADTFDRVEQETLIKNPGMSDADRRSIASAKKMFKNYRDLSDLRVNQLKEDLTSIKDNIAGSKKKYYEMSQKDSLDKEGYNLLKSLKSDIGSKINQKDKIKKDLMDIKEARESGKYIVDLQGNVSGKNLKNALKNIRDVVNDWESIRVKQGASSKVKEKFAKDVQKEIDSGLLKNLEGKYGDRTLAQEKYSGIMGEMSPMIQAKKGVEKEILGMASPTASAKEGVENKLLKIAKEISDPNYKGTFADIIRKFDENTKSEIYQKLRDIGLLDKFTGKGDLGSGSLPFIAGQIMSRVAAPSTRMAIKGSAAVTSKVAKLMKDGNYTKLGKYGPRFLEAFQSGGIPAVISLEYTLQQQDPEFQKTISE